ncbi:hypothetical protein FRC07_010937, partial [Ceratobasidium sp. 392]
MGKKQKEKAARKAISEGSIPEACSLVSCQASVGRDYDNLHASFHELWKEHRALAFPLPDIARAAEETARYTRALLIKPYLLHREDAGAFGTKKAIENLKDASVRLRSYLRTAEERMTTLILCTYENQNHVAGFSAQMLSCTDKLGHSCKHHDEDPGYDLCNRLIFPVARRYRQQVAERGVVNTFYDSERRRFQMRLLAKLGIHVFDGAEETVLVADWNSLVDHERAHIAAAYFRRVIFKDSHLFVPAHFHAVSFKQRIIDLPNIITPAGEELDLAEEIDASLLCMITFILSPSLH